MLCNIHRISTFMTFPELNLPTNRSAPFITFWFRPAQDLPVFMEIEGHISDIWRVELEHVLQVCVSNNLLLSAKVNQGHERHLLVGVELRLQVLGEGHVVLCFAWKTKENAF